MHHVDTASVMRSVNAPTVRHACPWIVNIPLLLGLNSSLQLTYRRCHIVGLELCHAQPGLPAWDQKFHRRLYIILYLISASSFTGRASCGRLMSKFLPSRVGCNDAFCRPAELRIDFNILGQRKFSYCRLVLLVSAEGVP